MDGVSGPRFFSSYGTEASPVLHTLNTGLCYVKATQIQLVDLFNKAQLFSFCIYIKKPSTNPYYNQTFKAQSFGLSLNGTLDRKN